MTPVSALSSRPDHARLIVDLGALVENYRRLCERARGAGVAAVVKADAYGLGAVRVARALWAAGCRHFVVAHVAEGVALSEGLRGLGAALPEIAVLHGVSPADGDDGAFWRSHNLTPVLNSLAQIDRWQDCARRLGMALPAYIHLDTGMNRLGLPPEESAKLLADPALWLKGIELRGWMSHLACAEDPLHPLNGAQLARFSQLTARLPPAPKSLANSSGIFLGPAWRFDMVRPGIALYGINPTPKEPNPMRAVVRLEAPVLSLHSIDSGESVGYGAAWQSERPSLLATLAIGYADGWFRSLGDKWSASFAGVQAPLVGRVSMDLVVADVTGLPAGIVEPGCDAALFDQTSGQTVDDVARAAGTIGYEVLTRLTARVERVYHDAEH